MSAVLSAFLAASWLCISPLAVPANPALLPASPVTLALTAEADGAFSATGQSLFGSEPVPLEWQGNWSVHDAQLAMIGRWSLGHSTAEMRGFSSVMRADVLILGLRDDNGAGLTLRCLTQREQR